MNSAKKPTIKLTVTILFSAILCIITAWSLSGCGTQNSKSESTGDEASAQTESASTEDEVSAGDYLESIGISAAELEISPNVITDDNPVGFQLDMPEEGDSVAVIHTSYGDITLRLFPEQAPKAVTNFVNLAKEGKYDSSLFSKVTKDFMINGGYCGTASYGSAFEDEFCDKLFNIRGAVAMSNTGTDSNESAFFINQTTAAAFEEKGGWSYLEEQWSSIKTQLLNYKDSNLLSAFVEKNGTSCYDTDSVPDEVKKLYETYGGNPYLDGAYNAVDRGYTVFAQVIDGMDVVDKIAEAEVDDDDIPVKSIIIESIEITEYKAETAAASTLDDSTGETSNAAETTAAEE